jgi:peptidoglycan-associated lipoprotein
MNSSRSFLFDKTLPTACGLRPRGVCGLFCPHLPGSRYGMERTVKITLRPVKRDSLARIPSPARFGRLFPRATEPEFHRERDDQMTTKFSMGLCSAVLLCGSTVGCAKKVAVAKPPAPPVASERPAAPAPSVPAAVRTTPARPASPVQTASNRTPDAATRARIQGLLNRIQDAYFDYNQQNIRPDAEAALRNDAQTLSQILRDFPDYKLTVEGHCDERGSEEYNLALGEARAQRAKAFLTDSGIPGTQVRTISYGKERPVCTEDTEACWQKNRRAHITQSQ